MEERMMILLNIPVHSISITFLQIFLSGVNMSSSYQVNFNGLKADTNFLSFFKRAKAIPSRRRKKGGANLNSRKYWNVNKMFKLLKLANFEVSKKVNV